jgi:multiple sugar transport system permease protein
VLFLALVVLMPLTLGFWLSLHSWSPIAGLDSARWVGPGNYSYLLTIDPRFKSALQNSVVYAIARLVGNVVLGLAVALLMNDRRIWGLRGWRVALFLPMATSAAVLGKVWATLFHKDFGILNTALRLFGIPSIGWLTNPSSALLAVIIMGTYQFTGYYTLIFLAGLQGIPEDLLEAARVDGANALRCLWYVTLPLLRPVIAFVVVMSTIGGLQVFDLVYSSTGGGPADATLTVVLQMYRTVFVFGRAGQGLAMAFMLFAIVIVLSIFQLWLLRQKT